MVHLVILFPQYRPGEIGGSDIVPRSIRGLGNYMDGPGELWGEKRGVFSFSNEEYKEGVLQ